jgi:hypothetical protein
MVALHKTPIADELTSIEPEDGVFTTTASSNDGQYEKAEEGYNILDIRSP